jgi:hypothetical protein
MCKEKIGEKALICGLAEVLSPQKSLGPQIANPQITKSKITKKYCDHKSQIRKHICGRPANLTNCLNSNLRIWDLRNLFADPHPPPLCSLSRVHSRTYSNQLRSYTPKKYPSPPSSFLQLTHIQSRMLIILGVFLGRLFLQVFSTSHKRGRGGAPLWSKGAKLEERAPVHY